MADRKISDLTALTTPASGDYLPIVDISEASAANKNKRITIEELLRGAPDGTAGAPGIGFESDPNTGIYSPGADQVAISTGGTGRLFIDASGNVGLGITPVANTLLGGARGSSLPGLIELAGNGNTVGSSGFAIGQDGSGVATLFQRANAAMYFATNGSERLRITSAGLVGIGTSSPGSTLHVAGAPGTSTTSNLLSLRSLSAPNASNLAQVDFWCANNGNGLEAVAAIRALNPNAAANNGGALTFAVSANGSVTTPTERMRIDQAGNVGIGTTSPTNALLHVSSPVSAGAIKSEDTAGSGSFVRILGDAGSQNLINWKTGTSLRFASSDDNYGSFAERARIDSSGRLLVGTSSARSPLTHTPRIQVEGLGYETSTVSVISNSNDTNGAYSFLGKSRGTSLGSNTIVQSNDEIGGLDFIAADGTQLLRAARITALVDGTPGANDMPGRLVFSTTADGASSPTERMRITQSGFVNIGSQGTDIIWNQTSATGVTIGTVGVIQVARSNDQLMLLNRIGNDGTLITFAQDGAVEGDISISGSTVSYNGAHLSRWSQLPGGAERTEILRGSVLSNIDEMCEWGDEDNEQLNRMKVSDVEGDKNVSGVFQAWDDDDDTYTNDFYCAMTGDFIIRIAAGVTVERGDLLMSAGDGTAKPQDDDIIRSKTIAKVTSTTVSCTYEDGSYCVPCVLMAC